MFIFSFLTKKQLLLRRRLYLFQNALELTDDKVKIKNIFGDYTPDSRLEGEEEYWRGRKGIGGTLRHGLRGIYELI